jgi:ribosomal-protein-alanine N-acetyltransferase
MVSANRYEQTSGLRLAEGIQEFLSAGSPEYVAEIQSATAADPWRLGFAVVLEETTLVVGMCGFKGPPDADGMAEIAYGIAPAWQGKGLATLAANELIDFARRSRLVVTLRAHTLPEPNASTRVLGKCAFQRTGEINDPADGLVWRWERRLDPAD